MLAYPPNVILDWYAVLINSFRFIPTKDGSEKKGEGWEIINERTRVRKN